jgi:signal transduction histidine kinase/CheY-like chemotaxis protein
MLLAVLLPVLLIAGMLTAVFLTARMDDMGQAYRLKSQALIRQLAASSEYGLFSANTVQLQALAHAALRESDVVSVVMLDDRGAALVSAGQRRMTHLPALSRTGRVFFDAMGQIDLWVQPVFPSPIALDDFVGTARVGPEFSPHLLGHVLVEFSQVGLLSRAHEVLLLGLAVLAVGLLLAIFLAIRLGQGVMRPIFSVSQLIERIGHGEFSARNEVVPNDPLRELTMALNKTAERLESSRDDLEQRIAWATEALREKKEEAEMATLSKSRFLAAASHDLRQPTHALGMFVARLAQLSHAPETKGLIKSLESSVQAMQDLLDALLDVSRLEAHAVPVQLSVFAIDDVFEKLRGTFALLAQEKGLSFHVRSSPVWVQSDSDLLSRVLMNLVSNALKYTHTGGVVVGCRLVSGGGARLEVWDSGQGIAPEHHQAIFTEFFQVGNAQGNRSRGLGLGLNIVQSILKLLGYSLAFRSRLGHGSRFFFELPIAPPGLALALAKQDVTAPTQEFEACRVLLVEDDLLASAGLESLLASWGCRLRCAVGLPEALAHLNGGWVPDLVISDYHLADGANGIDTIKQVRAKAGGSMAACLMSGDMNQDVSLASRAALLTLLYKPVRPAKLRSLIRHLLKNAGLI